MCQKHIQIYSDLKIITASFFSFEVDLPFSVTFKTRFLNDFLSVPNLLQKAITATQSSLESQLQILLERVNILTAAVERCLRPPGKPEREELFGIKYKVLEAESKEGPEQGDNDHTEKLHKISTKQIQMVLDGLATARQLEVYLRCLIN